MSSSRPFSHLHHVRKISFGRLHHPRFCPCLTWRQYHSHEKEQADSGHRRTCDRGGNHVAFLREDSLRALSLFAANAEYGSGTSALNKKLDVASPVEGINSRTNARLSIPESFRSNRNLIEASVVSSHAKRSVIETI